MKWRGDPSLSAPDEFDELSCVPTRFGHQESAHPPHQRSRQPMALRGLSTRRAHSSERAREGRRALSLRDGDDESCAAQGGQYLFPVCRTPGLHGEHHLNFVQCQLGCCAGVHHVENAGPGFADHAEQPAESARSVRDGDLHCEIAPGCAQPVGDHVGQYQRVDIAARQDRTNGPPAGRVRAPRSSALPPLPPRPVRR